MPSVLLDGDTWDAIQSEMLRQREKYTFQHDLSHVTLEPYVCMGLVSQYMAAGEWVKAAAMACNFALVAAYVERRVASANGTDEDAHSNS